MYVCLYVCMYVCLYVCMYPCTSPLLPSISRRKHCFSSVFAKMMSKNTEFFQIFGKRMQEAQASKKAGRGNRAWDPCFATPGPRRLRLVERHQIAARSLGGGGPPPPHVSDVGWGGVRGGGYPLSSLRCPTRREMSADLREVTEAQSQVKNSMETQGRTKGTIRQDKPKGTNLREVTEGKNQGKNPMETQGRTKGTIRQDKPKGTNLREVTEGKNQA